jgi:hypothetical protein
MSLPPGSIYHPITYEVNKIEHLLNRYITFKVSCNSTRDSPDTHEFKFYEEIILRGNKESIEHDIYRIIHEKITELDYLDDIKRPYFDELNYIRSKIPILVWNVPNTRIIQAEEQKRRDEENAILETESEKINNEAWERYEKRYDAEKARERIRGDEKHAIWQREQEEEEEGRRKRIKVDGKVDGGCCKKKKRMKNQQRKTRQQRKNMNLKLRLKKKINQTNKQTNKKNKKTHKTK